MGLTTIALVALAAVGGAAAGGAFSGKPKKPRFPVVKTPTLRSASTKIKAEEGRAKAYLATQAKRGRSRAKSQITMPGYLDPAQVQRPTLSNVLG